MKIAVCLRGAVAKIDGHSFFIENSLYRAGRYVNINACYNSVKKHIVDANQNCSFDFFIHCWNQDLQDPLINLYQPKKFLFEDNSIYNSEINKKIREPQEFTGISHALSIKKSIELSESQNEKYDLVILFRPDLILLKDMDLSVYDPNQIYVNGHTPPDPVGDFHFVMGPKIASEFKNLYDGVEKGNPCKHHFWMKNYVNNFMHRPLVDDAIIAGTHEEVLRKINIIMIKGKGITLEKFLEYGMTREEILQCNYP
jgi:hypothetical protein